MELHVWSGDWDLPSVDHLCLSALVYCKFSSIPIDIKKTNNPWRSPSGELPVLKYDDGKEADPNKIFEILRKQDTNVEQVLTAKQSADTLAFVALLEDKLLPGLLYMQWVDNTTYVDLTRPWYAKAVGLPLSLFLPNTKRKKVIAQLHSPYSGNPVLSDADLEDQQQEDLQYPGVLTRSDELGRVICYRPSSTSWNNPRTLIGQIVRDAKECLNLLSVKLGNSSFFFDDRPTKLDAIVFGYLAPLLKMPLSNPLQVHLKACRNLVNLCQKILTQYFPLSPEELEAKQKQDEQAAQRSSEDADYPHRKRNMFLAGLLVAGAMAAYALLTGLVQFELIDRDTSETAVIRSESDEDD